MDEIENVLASLPLTRLEVDQETIADWHAQFGDRPDVNEGKSVIEASELRGLVRVILVQMAEQYPDDDMIESGIVLQSLSDAGFTQALEEQVEPICDDALRLKREYRSPGLS